MSMESVENARARLQVIIGEKELSLKELSEIGEGSIVELDSLEGEPVRLVVAGELFARGEVVVIDYNFGVRVTELVDSGSGT